MLPGTGPQAWPTWLRGSAQEGMCTTWLSRRWTSLGEPSFLLETYTRNTKMTSTTCTTTECRYDARNVALSPPCSVYTTTPSGMRKLAAYRFMPVNAFTTEEPPNSNIDETMMFVMKQKHRNTMCVAVPHRARTISQMVCAAGALRLISMAKTPNSSTWTVAPDAYQNGPDTPYCHATFELCNIVAAHVHCAHAPKPPSGDEILH